MADAHTSHLPPRVGRPQPVSIVMFLAFLVFFAWSVASAGISIPELLAGLPNMGKIASEMVPPATDRVTPVLNSVLVTFQMALVGTVIGIIISLPLAILAARNHTPHP